MYCRVNGPVCIILKGKIDRNGVAINCCLKGYDYLVYILQIHTGICSNLCIFVPMWENFEEEKKRKTFLAENLKGTCVLTNLKGSKLKLVVNKLRQMPVKV